MKTETADYHRPPQKWTAVKMQAKRKTCNSQCTDEIWTVYNDTSYKEESLYVDKNVRHRAVTSYCMLHLTQKNA